MFSVQKENDWPLCWELMEHEEKEGTIYLKESLKVCSRDVVEIYFIIRLQFTKSVVPTLLSTTIKAVNTCSWLCRTREVLEYFSLGNFDNCD